MLTVRGLTKHYSSSAGDVPAVRGISFDIQAGDFYTLLGPSGCGKTTTLQCVAGLERPTSGEIVMGNTVVFSSSQGINVPGHQRDLGMVFQSYAIWPHMTVFENVAFPLVHGRRRLPGAQVQERVLKALDLVQLGGLEHRPAPFLSGGQQQRVALARALVHEPKLLLLDEPLSNLDAKLRDDMRVELRLLVKQLQITTLYVTHDQVEALSMSDRIAVMQGGLIVQEGTPREIYLSPKDRFVASFIGRSNFLPAQVVKPSDGHALAEVDTAIGRLRCHVPSQHATGSRVVVAARPEGVEVLLSPPASGRENAVDGTVELTSFVGDSLQCLVRVGDELIRANADALWDLAPAQRVYLRFPPERCVVIPTAP